MSNNGTTRVGFGLALGALLGACAAPRAEVRAPATHGVQVVAFHGTVEVEPPPEEGGEIYRFARGDKMVDAVRRSDGLVFIQAPDPGTKQQQIPVAPAPLDLSEVPLVSFPEPLAAADAPAALPPGDDGGDLLVAELPSRPRAHHLRATNRRRSVSLKQGSDGRLQIGNINPNGTSARTAYRYCGGNDKRPRLAPARWQLLTAVDEQLQFMQVDGWFDDASCSASVVSRTVVTPKPLLGGLAYAFRTACDECPSGQYVHFIMPQASRITVDSIGGDASAISGSYSYARLPLRRGDAASLSATLPAFHVKRWAKQLNHPALEVDNVLLGIDVAQAVGEQAPTAIGYATLMHR